MSVSLSDTVDDLLRRPTQDPGRLHLLAQFCIEAFDREGLPGVRGGKANEVGIRGLGRQKDWDLAYVLAGKPRLLISLKSILKNLAGTVPNRLDDLMGEECTATFAGNCHRLCGHHGRKRRFRAPRR